MSPNLIKVTFLRCSPSVYLLEWGRAQKSSFVIITAHSRQTLTHAQTAACRHTHFFAYANSPTHSPTRWVRRPARGAVSGQRGSWQPTDRSIRHGRDQNQCFVSYFSTKFFIREESFEAWLLAQTGEILCRDLIAYLCKFCWITSLITLFVYWQLILMGIEDQLKKVKIPGPSALALSALWLFVKPVLN